MAKIGEGVHINAESVSRHFRLPVSEGPNCILINAATNSVSSLQTADKKLLQTWTLSNPECFTSPVVYSPMTNSVYCVVDNKKLLIWNLDSENLKAAQKQKFDESILAVVPVEGIAPLIVFCTGKAVSVNSLDDSTSYIAPYEMVCEEELIWVDATLLKKDVVVMQLTYNSKTKQHKLRSFALRNGKIDITSVNCIDLSRESTYLKGYCLNRRLKQVRFLSIWSDGEVHSYSCVGATSEFLFKVLHVDETLSIAIDTIGSSHLAVVKFESSQIKQDAIQTSYIEVWDLKYSIKKARKELKPGLSKKVQIKSFGSSVFMSYTDSIVVVPVTLESCTLSAVVGKSVSTAKSSAEENYSWSDDRLAEDRVGTSDDPKLKRLCIDEFLEGAPKMTVDELKTYAQNLKKSSDVSEKELIALLKVALNKEDSASHEDFNDDKNKFNIQHDLLNTIFCISFSDIFLRQHLRELTFTETVVILKSLLQIFNSQLFSNEDSQRPTDLQVINWMQLLMQVHFEELLLSPDKEVQQLLQALQKSLLEKMDVYNELREIKYLLMIQKKKNILPEKRVNSKYCIETLQL